MDLKNIRQEIDQIDDQIFELFMARMDLSKEVAEAKKASKLAIENKNREEEILSRMSQKSEEMAEYSQVLYQTLFDLSKSYQKSLLDGEKD